MSSTESGSESRQIAVATLIVATALGLLVLYVFESVEALLVGFGGIICLGSFAAAYRSREQDRIGSPSISVRLILEFLLALAMAFLGFRFVASIHPIVDFHPNPVTYVGFYFLKLLFAYWVNTQVMMSKTRRRQLLITGYLLLVVPTTWLTMDGASDLWSEPFWLCMVLCMWFSTWFFIPTLTFRIDILSKDGLSFRYMIWRTVIEILAICPLTSLVAAFLWTLILSMLGVFPFGPG